MSALSVFRPRSKAAPDRLVEADLTTSMVLALFEDAIEDLEHVSDLGHTEWEEADATIKNLQRRQQQAVEVSAKATRVRLRLRELIS